MKIVVESRLKYIREGHSVYSNIKGVAKKTSRFNISIVQLGPSLKQSLSLKVWTKDEH